MGVVCVQLWGAISLRKINTPAGWDCWCGECSWAKACAPDRIQETTDMPTKANPSKEQGKKESRLSYSDCPIMV